MRHEPNEYRLFSSVGRRLTGLLIFSLVWFSAGFAQTGPGGVGNSTSNLLWLRADSITGSVNTDRVQNWYDVSGNANHVSQTTPGNRPRYYTNVLNGFPVVRFERVNSEFLEGNLGGTLNSPFRSEERRGGKECRYRWCAYD